MTAGAAARVAIVLSSAATLILAGAPGAAAQDRYPATVTDVVDGDTVDAQLASGPTLRVRLIGIDAPDPGDCGADSATAALEQLVLGRTVTLVTDPTQGAVDESGRSLFYVDRDDGLDSGLEMLRAGWAQVFADDVPYQRVVQYRAAEREAAGVERGVWARCAGDFHRSREDQLRELRSSAVAFMRSYYRRVSNRRFVAAWSMLGRRVRRDIGPFRAWRAGHRGSLGASVRSARARLSSGRAVVSIRLVGRHRDACSGRAVRQVFRGRWVLAPRRDAWVAVRVRMRKTGGGPVRLSKSECKPPPDPPSQPPSRPRPPANCQGYDPCLTPGPDVDCAGGSGDGPRYVNGPVYVNGDDPYDLDRDGDGVACES
jgi:endonuclease YncB( thermonuclease family)